LKKILLVILLMLPLSALLWYLYYSTLDTPQWVYSEISSVNFSKTEITVGQYRLCTDEGVCSAAGNSSDKCNNYHDDKLDHPVNCVSWVQAERYCQWVGGRLPTDIEWYAEASNGGTREYTWGDETPSCEYAIIAESGSTSGCDADGTWPVCSRVKGNSVSGLCDMTGNVWEWTSSGDAKKKVIRGGSAFDTNPGMLDLAFKHYSSPSAGYRRLGFRCAKDM